MPKHQKQKQTQFSASGFLTQYVQGLLNKGKTLEEIVTFAMGENTFSFRCYTQAQWEANHERVKPLQLAFGNHINGFPVPHHIIGGRKQGWRYYVDVLEEKDVPAEQIELAKADSRKKQKAVKDFETSAQK